MSVEIKMTFPNSAFAVLRRKPKDFAREMRIAASVKWFEAGILSQGKAAELSGLSRTEFLGALSRLKVSPFQYDPGDLAKEMRPGAVKKKCKEKRDADMPELRFKRGSRGKYVHRLSAMSRTVSNRQVPQKVVSRRKAL